MVPVARQQVDLEHLGLGARRHNDRELHLRLGLPPQVPFAPRAVACQACYESLMPCGHRRHRRRSGGRSDFGFFLFDAFPERAKLFRAKLVFRLGGVGWVSTHLLVFILVLVLRVIVVAVIHRKLIPLGVVEAIAFDWRLRARPGPCMRHGRRV